MTDTRIIKKPVISEKTLDLAKRLNTYTFLVDRLANKNQIKEAVESLFKVTVEDVKTSLSYRTFKTTGRKRMKSVVNPVKKAMITLKKGDTIDLFEFDRGN